MPLTLVKQRGDEPRAQAFFERMKSAGDRPQLLLGSSQRHGIAAAIVHDFRSPLAAIRLGAEMLTNTNLSQREIELLSRSLRESSLRINELLQEFLDLLSGMNGHSTRTNIGDLVCQAIGKVACAADSQEVVVFENVPEDLVMTLDRQRMLRVLVNLLVNALEAMPDGGSILVSVTTHECVEFVVEDTGPGFPPEIRDRLFEPFVTARKERGMGLGLAVSRQVVLDLGGDMWAEVPEGGGARIVFRLPRE